MAEEDVEKNQVRIREMLIAYADGAYIQESNQDYTNLEHVVGILNGVRELYWPFMPEFTLEEVKTTLLKLAPLVKFRQNNARRGEVG